MARHFQCWKISLTSQARLSKVHNFVKRPRPCFCTGTFCTCTCHPLEFKDWDSPAPTTTDGAAPYQLGMPCGILWPLVTRFTVTYFEPPSFSSLTSFSPQQRDSDFLRLGRRSSEDSSTQVQCPGRSRAAMLSQIII
jgi:hypothetical protein